MNLEEFRSLSGSYVVHDNFLTFAAVLSIAYAKAIEFDKPRAFEKQINHRVYRTLTWLEIVFFLDTEAGDIAFYGVKPACLDMHEQEAVLEFPVMAFDASPGQPQSIDWEAIVGLCAAFNANLPHPASLPFVRIALDETRTRSVYYQIQGWTYPL